MEKQEARRTIESELALLRERSKRTATRWSWLRDCGASARRGGRCFTTNLRERIRKPKRGEFEKLNEAGQSATERTWVVFERPEVLTDVIGKRTG